MGWSTRQLIPRDILLVLHVINRVIMRWGFLGALSECLVAAVAIGPLNKLHILIRLHSFHVFLQILLVGRHGDLVLEDLPLVLLVLAGLDALADAVVGVVGVHVGWGEEISRRNINILNILRAERALSRVLINVAAADSVLRLGRKAALVQVGLHLLVSVQILDHQIKIILIIQNFNRLILGLSIVFYHAAGMGAVSVPVADCRDTR